MAQSPVRTWKIRRGGSVVPFGVVGLGILTVAVNLAIGENTAGEWVFTIAISVAVVAVGLYPFAFVARHISCDETGCFRFRTSIREVIAEPGSIISVERFKTPEWTHPHPVLVRTSKNRILVTQWIEHKQELREALLNANPQMKIGPRTLSEEVRY